MPLADQEAVESVSDAGELHRFVSDVSQYQVQASQLLVFLVGLHTDQARLHGSTEPEISAGEI